ncbi:uncharacterized protein HKW66_Vig0204360 [Vigna angularis]|uniref:Uncharacterized protein n=1 Tax=Phaseolus angularis TaxID=3914 RepID=A0A8T0JTI4_PHAAN|nr:uncharacterized protein HKW66_Vig0204360 [Vigna angularis]
MINTNRATIRSSVIKTHPEIYKYKFEPETFQKVRPRCEAPRRDMTYPTSYTPCRYVRISCLRGNPIAIFFVQLIGVSVPGLEAEFQPVVNYLLPHILSHKQDPHDIHLQFTVVARCDKSVACISSTIRGHSALYVKLQTDLSSFPDNPESNLRFLAMVAGPLYPILHVVNESKLAERSSDFWAALPLIQALLPALRPWVSNSFDVVDDTFSQWKQPIVQQALSQARAACVLIDLCSGVLAPWMTQVIAKVDLALELLEDLLGIIQDAHNSLVRARAALKYIVLALSGHMDDILGKYKEVKLKILFLVEMLDPFLDPAIAVSKSKIAFGDLASSFPEKQEQNCTIALNIIRSAVRKPAVLPSLESEWRNGSVAPSVLLSILEPHMCLPPDVDLCKSVLRPTDHETASISPLSSGINGGGTFSKSIGQDDSDGKTDVSEAAGKSDSAEDRSLLFSPPELQSMTLTNFSNVPKQNSSISSIGDMNLESKNMAEKHSTDHFLTNILDAGLGFEYFNVQADYFQLLNYNDSELRASEFRRLALDLHSQSDVTIESHDAAIDALLLAAECHVNPYFISSIGASSKLTDLLNINECKTAHPRDKAKVKRTSGKNKPNLDTIAHIERKRDKLVFQILLEAAELDRKYNVRVSGGEIGPYSAEGFDEQIIKLSPLDVQYADALTLVRQNQALLCNFLIQRLQGDQISMHEILLQSLVYFLHTGTKLYCPPEHVIDIIIKYAEDLNRLLASFHHQLKESSLYSTQERMKGVERRWLLLQRLVIAASGGAVVDDVVSKKYEELKVDDSQVENSSAKTEFERGNQCDEERSFCAIYPELWKFFPNMKRKFKSFGEAILEAVGLQLRSVPSILVPDVLCWFSELCLWPFSFASSIGSDHLKGYNAKNARAIILYILEAIIVEHMEAMVPEAPKLVQVLVSLSSSTYCDVSFLDSVLRLLKPILSYSLSKISHDENLLDGDSCLNFEELCFNTLLMKIKQKSEVEHNSEDKGYNTALAIFILASIFPDLSIRYRREFLQSLLNLANFPAFSPTTFFFDYLSAFQCVMDNCKLLLLNNLKELGVVPLQLSPYPHANGDGLFEDNLKPNSWFLSDVCLIVYESDVHNVDSNNSIADVGHCDLPSDYLEGFCKDIEGLISNLNPAIERCWNLHPQISRKVSIASAECYVFSKCLTSVSQKFHKAEDDQNSSIESSDMLTLHWRIGLQGLCELAVMLQESSCWEVSCLMLDCLLGVPYSFSLDGVVGIICSTIKNVSCCAPKISWRVQSDKWLTSLIARGIYNSQESEVPLIDLFCTLLVHAEPEQRFIAVKHLGILLGQCTNGERAVMNSKICSDFIPNKLVLSIPDYVLSRLVSSTWDEVVVLASSDLSVHLRVHAMALLSNYIPFAERHHLQSFLVAADGICYLCNAKASQDGPFLQLSLTLIAYACLYSPAEDISLIPQNLWENIETLGSTKHAFPDGKLGDLEKRTCQVLCRLRDEGDEAKEQYDPDFANTRESINQLVCILVGHSSQIFGNCFMSYFLNILSLQQVLGNLTAVHSYFDLFSWKIEQDDMELEEAELELDIIRKEHSLPGRMEDSKELSQIPANKKDVSRLQQIKECIHSLEKSKLKEDIAARRQKKLLMRQARQKHLEEAAVREAELLQELDRERTVEMEKELERQRLLEIERAKTKELRYNLDMEKERQTQRELQREIEQAESGLRPSRRDFSSSTHNNRPRDRFRERENGRSGNEGSTRAGSGSLQSEIPSTSSSIVPSPTIVLSGSRTFTGQLPTILQSRDRQDDTGSMYEENVDGSKDSGDTSSIGDPELVSAFEGPSSGYGSQRHSSRGSKSRQLGERRDRDSRREGKWERKHS